MKLIGFPLDNTAWQWQPTLTSHDPNPPITLENAPPPPSGSVTPLIGPGPINAGPVNNRRLISMGAA